MARIWVTHEGVARKVHHPERWWCDKRWTTVPEEDLGLELRGLEYWISSVHLREEHKDTGPFDTLEAAAACFETLVGGGDADTLG